jgi:hypothetical protein
VRSGSQKPEIRQRQAVLAAALSKDKDVERLAGTALGVSVDWNDGAASRRSVEALP